MKEKHQLNEMISLINRMDKPQTGWQKMLNESTQVIADNLVNFLSKCKVQEGQFCRLGYIQLYTIPGQYPNDELYGKMQGLGDEFNGDGITDRARANYQRFMDKSQNPEWDNPTGRAYKGAKSFGTNIYKYIIKLTKYNLHWQEEAGYARAQERNGQKYKEMVAGIPQEYYDELGIQYQDDNGEYHNSPSSTNTGPTYKYMGEPGRFGVATDTDAEGNPRMTSYRTNVDDPNSTVEIDGLAIRNMLSNASDQQAVFFGVYENGDIDQIGDGLGRMLYRTADSYAAKLQSEDLQNNPEKLAHFKVFYDFKRNENMTQKIFKLSNVAYFCATGVDMSSGAKDSMFWVNREPLFLLEKTINKEKVRYTAPINTAELENILRSFASKEADGMVTME